MAKLDRPGVPGDSCGFRTQYGLETATTVTRSGCLCTIHIVPTARLAAQLARSLEESEVSDMGIGIGRAAAIGTAMILVTTAFTGCADLSPIKREFKDIQAQLKQVSSDVVAMESSLDQATEASRQAKEAADNAASTANQALAIALSAQRSVRATNERLEQLSPDHPSK